MHDIITVFNVDMCLCVKNLEPQMFLGEGTTEDDYNIGTNNVLVIGTEEVAWSGLVAFDLFVQFNVGETGYIERIVEEGASDFPDFFLHAP